MSRWAAAFKAALAAPMTHDTVDSVDTVGPGPEPPPQSVNTVNSVMCHGSKNEDAEAAVWEAELDGLRRAAMQKPPSWSDPAAVPSHGCWCSCCRGVRWWAETIDPKGWRCRTCHPPPGALDAVREVQT